jgi:hypothetical protein
LHTPFTAWFRYAAPLAESVGAFRSAVSDGSSRRRNSFTFAEADDRSDNNAVPTVDRPQPDRTL